MSELRVVFGTGPIGLTTVVELLALRRPDQIGEQPGVARITGVDELPEISDVERSGRDRGENVVDPCRRVAVGPVGSIRHLLVRHRNGGRSRCRSWPSLRRMLPARSRRRARA